MRVTLYDGLVRAFGFFLIMLGPALYGQQPSQAAQDPLMQLMLAQPKIDVDSPVTPVVSFEPRVIKPGEPCTYRVTINALETAIEWPDKIPVPQGVSMREGARGQILSMIGAMLVPRTTFNYRLTASTPGVFTIPEFTIRVNGKSVNVPASEIVVSANPVAGLAPAQVLLLDLPTNGLYVGQAVRARVLLPGAPGGTVQSLGQVQVNGQGFIVDQSSAHARIEVLAGAPGKRPVNTFVYELMLTPIAVGKITLSAQAYAVGNRVMGGVIMP
ncbi:MAG TPA: BatD family protein, partial [Verrucomicrobiae bacterium]|nr:BatD family protein [Verrucomicrobiae bacterium]